MVGWLSGGWLQYVMVCWLVGCSASWLINDEAFKDFKLAKKRLTMPNRRRDEKGGMMMMTMVMLRC